MTQAVAETLPTVDMVKKAMLSTSGDGDALLYVPDMLR